ncbi:MAG: polysaccharide biosynthesis protein [Planctomycetaceae bacterium]|nr:polysaccharide biosynthesis protein [Planctomycetaceae bacterium]
MSVRNNILAGWVAHLVTVLIGFFLMPYILGTVGEAQYGAWIFINAIASYSNVLYSGFGATLVRYVADLSAREDQKRLNSFVSNIQLVYFGTATLVMLCTALAAWIVPDVKQWEGVAKWEMRYAILIVGTTIATGMVASVYGGILVGTQRLDLKRAIEVSMGITRLVLTLVCLRERFGLMTLAAIFFAITLFEHGLSACLAYRQCPGLRIRFWNYNRETMRECFGFSSMNAIALIAEYMIYFTDTIVIGFVLGPKAVVPYQIGLRIVQMIQIPIAQIGEAVLPKAGELHAKESSSELGPLVARGMGLAFLLAGGFLIGATYFGQLLINTWIGPGYGESYPVLVILLGAQMVALPMVVARKALLGTGQIRLQVVIDLMEAICNLGLSLLFVSFWGIMGVAWGTFVPLVVIELFVLLPCAMKLLHLRVRSLWKETIAPQLPAFAVLLVACDLVSRRVPETGWLPLMAATAIGGGALVAVRYGTHLLEKRDLTASVSPMNSPETTPQAG